MEFKPYPYQEYAIEHIIANPYAGLFLEMGLGKTVSTLTAIDRLMNDYFEVNKVLVIAPLRVADVTWGDEVMKWDHLKHLAISKVLGCESKRIDALRAKADIYVINRENVPWLVGFYGRAFPFDMVVVDELSSFKSAKALRFKALRQVRPLIKRVVGLTGTPAPNGLIDLWPQVFLLDEGVRLGRFITGYRKEFFTPGRTNGQVVFNYKAKESAEKEIYNRISDICISMKSEDYLSMPQRIDRKVEVRLSDKVKKLYDDFEKEQVLEFMDSEINAATAAVLTGKLLQFAGGAVYDNEKNVKVIHDEKLSALEDILESANGKPVLVFYSYKHDRDRITKRFKDYKPRNLVSADDVHAWNKGEIELMLAHPASTGHGLNLQAGGNIIVWFGLTWSLELYQQANARLYRQGQESPTVIIHHLVVKDTVDEDVLLALAGKAEGQDALMNAVQARIEKYKDCVSR